MNTFLSPDEFVAFLRRIPHAGRSSLILDRLRTEIAAILKVKTGGVNPDAAIPKVACGSNSVAVARPALMLLRPAIRQSVGLHIYAKELATIPNLRHLANYLALEIEGPAAVADHVGLPVSGVWPFPRTRSAAALKVQNVAFILSSPRAGSTLLRVMLHGHPDIFAPPELNLLPFETMGQRAGWFRERECQWMGTGLTAAVAALTKSKDGIGQERVREWELADTPVIEVYRWLQEASGRKLLVDKSPLYALFQDCLQPALDRCPDAKYLHLVRHPCAVIESIVRMRFHRLYGADWPGFDPSPWKYAENCWTQSNENIRAFLDDIPSGQQRTVRFEDLLSDPRTVASEICAFLGIEFHPDVLTPYEGDRLTHHGTSDQPTLGDPQFLSHDSIAPERGTAWTKLQPNVSLRPAARRIAAEFGYDVALDA